MTKHLLLSVWLLLFFSLAFAQVPQKINYQAVARDASGNALLNVGLQVRFSVHDVSANGNTVYRETHSITTNALGVFSVVIGTGTVFCAHSSHL